MKIKIAATCLLVLMVAAPLLIGHSTRNHESISDSDFLNRKSMLLQNDNKTAIVILNTRRDGGSIAVISGEGQNRGAIDLSLGEHGYELGIIHNRKDRVVLGVNEHGDGIITLYDRHGHKTTFGGLKAHENEK